MGKIKIVFVVMVLITIVAGIAVAYAVATNDEEEIHRFCFEEICAHLLDEEPAKWVPANETDPYVMQAVQNPGQVIEAEVYIFNKTAEDWWIDEDGIEATFKGDYVEYEGNFYLISRAFAEPPLSWFLSEEIINQTPINIGALAVGWITFGVIAFGVVVAHVRRRPATTGTTST